MGATCCPSRPYSASSASDEEHDSYGSTVKEPSSPLSSILLDEIKIRGPMTVAQFMRHALTHPTHGYYMRKDVFGQQGDFTTAPEVSQMFGEMIGLWCVDAWKKIGSPREFQLIEMGPGRGTLMMDMLRAAHLQSDFIQAVQVHFLEASPALRRLQMQTVGCVRKASDAPMDLPSEPMRGMHSIPFHWHTHISSIPDSMPVIAVGQEFLDALPVHQFRYTDRGWREVLVDIDSDPSTPNSFRFVLSTSSTPASAALIRDSVARKCVVGDAIELSADAMSLSSSLAARIR